MSKSNLETERLCRLRRDYAERELGDVSVDLRRLEFVRWLVATGRLTDQLDAHQLPSVSQQHHVL